MIDRFAVEKYLGEGWKEFRDGEQWSDIGLLMNKMRGDVLLQNEFNHFAHNLWYSEKNPQTFGEPFIFWLFTPERFCNLVIEFWERDKGK